MRSTSTPLLISFSATFSQPERAAVCRVVKPLYQTTKHSHAHFQWDTMQTVVTSVPPAIRLRIWRFFHISATTPHLFNGLLYNLGKPVPEMYKKLSYRRGTARWIVSVKILPIATQQCRNYLYDKSWTNRSYEVRGLVGQCVINMCTQPWLDRVASTVR